MTQYALVYQTGIANVFRVDPAPAVRVCQHAYAVCEWFAAGLVEAGCAVAVYHCDEAGDIARLEWSEGAGELWRDKKHPPGGARVAVG